MGREALFGVLTTHRTDLTAATAVHPVTTLRTSPHLLKGPVVQALGSDFSHLRACEHEKGA